MDTAGETRSFYSAGTVSAQPPLRILFLGPDGVAHVTRWIRFLRERGHDVVLASAHRIDHDVPCGGVPLIANPGSAPMSVRSILTAARQARRLARDMRPDVVLSYYLSSYGVIGALAGYRPHVCATAGGDVLSDAFDSPRRKVVNRMALALVRRRSDLLLAWAPHVRDAPLARGVKADRVFVQPRGVMLDLFRFQPPRHRASGEPLRILSNRMLKPLYGVDVLVRALAHLQAQGAPFEARICGEGPERAGLESLARQLELRQVSFPGTVPAPQMPELLAWSDVYVSTSYTDGASSSLFEAMAVGRFPVVTDLPANRPYLEDARAGALFPPGDHAALGRILSELAANREASRLGGARAHEIAVERLDYRRNMEAITAAVAEVAIGRSPLRN